MDFCCIKHLDYRKSGHFQEWQTDFEQLEENCISGRWFYFACVISLRINEREFCRKYTEKRDTSCRQCVAVHVASILKSVTFM